MVFPNIAETQPRIAEDLERAIEGGFLPQSLLFSGPVGSSRLTSALDLSFFLTGELERRDILSSSQILYIPFRNLAARKDAAISLFEKQRTKAARLFLIETVRIILLQYHYALSGAYSSSQSSYFPIAEEVATALLQFEEDKDYTDKEIKDLVSLLNSRLNVPFINKGRKNTSITIDEVRAIQRWFSTGLDEKVAIIENLEESTEGAKNSLLKLLEEPDPHSHIILISSNPQRLLQTILSRVRKFAFPSLSEKNVTALLRKKHSLFRDYDSFDTFYFVEGSGEESRNKLTEAAKDVAEALVLGKQISKEREEELLSLLDSTGGYRYFRSRISQEIRTLLLDGKIDGYKGSAILKIINEWGFRSETFNLSERIALDSILREASRVK